MRRNIRWFAAGLMVTIWAALGIGTYLFSLKPPTCFEIRSLPYGIEAPGCYRLTADLTVSNPRDTGIVIRYGNVRLDLNGHRISTARNVAPEGVAIGIGIIGAKNVVVENGHIDGFLYGVRADPLGKLASENLTFRHLTISNSTFRGMDINGSHNVIENNIVENTGGTHLFENSAAVAIATGGPGCRVRGNRVIDLHPEGQGDAVGILASANSVGCEIERNDVYNAKENRKGVGVSYAGGRSQLTLRDNYVQGLGADTRKSCIDIGKLPVVISSPGCHRLSADLYLPPAVDFAIRVESDNVQLDLAGHRIVGRAAQKSDRSVGIVAVGVNELTVQRGRIEGFGFGITVRPDGERPTVSGIVLHDLTIARSTFAGAIVHADFARLDRITISDTGHGNLSSAVTGIELGGHDCSLHDSQVLNTLSGARARAVGVALTKDASRCQMERNTVMNRPATPSNALSYGVWRSVAADQVHEADNRIDGFAKNEQEGEY